MTIRDAIIDELLSGEDPQAVFAKDGLLEALKKALAERILDAELEHHLRGERAQAGRGTPRNHRNGAQPQDDAERVGQAGDRGAARPPGELRAATDCQVPSPIPRFRCQGDLGSTRAA